MIKSLRNASKIANFVMEKEMKQ